MSSYVAYAVHPVTDDTEKAVFVDDWFGPHRYGVRFPDGLTFERRRVKELGFVPDAEAAEIWRAFQTLGIGSGAEEVARIGAALDRTAPGAFDPANLTAYQRLVLVAWPSEGIPAFKTERGPAGRAEAVAGGAVDDPVLTGLLARLGPACADVDEAAARISEAADAVGAAFAVHGAETGEELRRIFGPLRAMAAKMWNLDDPVWGANPLAVAAAPRGP